MRIRQTLILSLTAAMVLVLLAPGSWARAQENTDGLPELDWMAQSGIESYCYALADCDYYPYYVSCEGTSYCSAQDDPNGYVYCDGQRTNCPCPYSVQVNLTETNCRIQGDKAIYTLKATASDGCGSYYFTWLGASASSGPTENPNYATSVVLYSSTTVQVTVTSGTQWDSDSMTLWPGCGP